MSGNAREPGRSTIDRLLTLLDVFDGTDLTLAEIAERAGLPLTTAHRMLCALERWGGIERAPSGHFRVGVRLWELGTRAAIPSGLREAALPLMQNLCESTTNVQLAIRDGYDALIIERLKGLRAVPTVTEVGGRLPLHATGVGKVLLAAAPADDLVRLLQRGLARWTPYTMTTPPPRHRHLGDARDRLGHRPPGDDAWHVLGRGAGDRRQRRGAGCAGYRGALAHQRLALRRGRSRRGGRDLPTDHYRRIAAPATASLGRDRPGGVTSSPRQPPPVYLVRAGR